MSYLLHGIPDRKGRRARLFGQGVAFVPPRILTATSLRSPAPTPTHVVSFTDIPRLLGPAYRPPSPIQFVSPPQPHFVAPGSQVTTTGKIVPAPPGPSGPGGVPILTGPISGPDGTGATGGGDGGAGGGGGGGGGGGDGGSGSPSGVTAAAQAQVPWLWIALAAGGLYVLTS